MQEKTRKKIEKSIHFEKNGETFSVEIGMENVSTSISERSLKHHLDLLYKSAFAEIICHSEKEATAPGPEEQIAFVKSILDGNVQKYGENDITRETYGLLEKMQGMSLQESVSLGEIKVALDDTTKIARVIAEEIQKVDNRKTIDKFLHPRMPAQKGGE